MYEELQSLYRLCKILSGEMEWLASEDDEEILRPNDKTAGEIDSFIQEMAHPLTKPVDVTVLSPIMDHMIYEPRTDLDCTEQLWLFCRDARSFEEIQLIFAEVIKAVLLGKIQPFVHRRSSSKLATLLRQVLLDQDGAALQDTALQFQLLLAEARLLPCLIQVGIEKIRRDYQSFFIGTDILSLEQLEQFFTPSSSLLVQCLELCRMHSVLELDASIMRVLRLPTTTTLSSLTKAAMEVFKTDPQYQPFEQTPVFSLPLPVYSPALKSVVAMCSKLSPTKWCLTSQQGTGRDGSVHLLSSQPLFGFLLEDSDSIQKDGCVYSNKCYCDTVYMTCTN
jgi:protein zwilch